MIRQYLSNINESATVFILQKNLELNKALIYDQFAAHLPLSKLEMKTVWIFSDRIRDV
jgi:hypothetical protein